MATRQNGLRSFLREAPTLLERKPSPEDAAQALAARLKAALADVSLPSRYLHAEPGRLGKYLLYKDEKLGFTVAALAWGARASMPIHNHATGWTVYAGYEGEVRVENYRVEREVGNTVILRRLSTFTLGKGETVSLSEPENDIHRVWNPRDGLAVTLHVWGRDPATVRRYAFEPLEPKGEAAVRAALVDLHTVYDNCAEAYEPAGPGSLRVKRQFSLREWGEA